ncbi:MAG: lamin tail domain-containing protein [Acidimicrobiia bacterium]|nr:lamin tail domain-containing protein [Acidimicrobiia bacterium]
MTLTGCGLGNSIGGSDPPADVADVNPGADPTDQEYRSPGEEASPSARSDDPGGDDGVVVELDRVVDGDSLELTVDGQSVELRLEGYNAPELYGATVDSSDERTCNGLAARDALSAVISSSSSAPRLVATGTDRFGRTLGDLLIDGRSVVEMMIDGGHGLATGDSDTNRELMWSAADREVGVWGDRCPPVDSGLRIGSVQNDPPGNDRYNLVDEWVEITNTGSVEESLDRWTVRDDTTGHRFELSGILGPGATLTVRSGGEPSDSDLTASDPTLYLGESFPVWSNSAETVILIDPTGAFVDWRFVIAG